MTDLVRVIWGTVDEDGHPVAPRTKNFDCKKTDTGKYELTFQNAITAIPTISVTSMLRSGESKGSNNVFSFSDVKTASATVWSVDVAEKKNKPQDEAFSFVAFFGELNPGVVFATVSQSGEIVTNAAHTGIKVRQSNSTTGKYYVNFLNDMETVPNIIVCSSLRDDEKDGSDNVFSVSDFNKSGCEVWSIDVGDDGPKHQWEAFSIFAWDKRAFTPF